MAWALWLAAALVLGIIEVLSVDLFFLMLAIAAGGGSLAAVFGLNLTWQIAVFSALSFLLLFLVRPWAKNLLVKSTPNIHTNVHALIGKTATVTEELHGEDGRIRLEGEIWSARTRDGRTMPRGTQVRVADIEGATAIVEAHH